MKLRMPEPTEGEEVIMLFLDEETIKYEREKKIDLPNEEPNYRVADFYLPKFKVYIEFLGQWNISEHKDRYNKKKDAYKNNKVPCIYLYPENLGILKILFYRRLKDVLRKHDMKKELFRLRLDTFISEHWLWLILLVVGIFYFPDLQAKIIIAIILVVYLYQGIAKHFFDVRNRFTK